MRAWLIFGYVFVLAAVLALRLIPAGGDAVFNGTDPGDWTVACLPLDGCQAWLDLEDGVPRKTEVRGAFGSLGLRLAVGPGGEPSFIATFDDHPVPTSDGVRIQALSVGKRYFALTCIQRACAVPAHRVALLVKSMREGKTLVVNPEGRPPVEVDIRAFAHAYEILEQKISGGDDAAATQAFRDHMHGEIANR